MRTRAHPPGPSLSSRSDRHRRGGVQPLQCEGQMGGSPPGLPRLELAGKVAEALQVLFNDVTPHLWRVW